ncbi:hypothetical protein WISP_19633 [Willisornis vidua]|uniref:NSMF factor n=1 Tax=Willisornis vidua TaxID=1566151 RepID=A0ABQ9DQ45_9PASS|nr:hypothetical protein WISP_19633 [Willisornis vidua]
MKPELCQPEWSRQSLLKQSGQRCIYLLVVLEAVAPQGIKWGKGDTLDQLSSGESQLQTAGGEALGNLSMIQDGFQVQKLTVHVLSLGGLFSEGHRNTPKAAECGSSGRSMLHTYTTSALPPPSPQDQLKDHLLAEPYLGQEDSPELQQAVQHKRRLSVISDGKFERSFSEEQGEKMPSEAPKPRVYTISGERPMLSEQESDSMELVVMKGGAQEECHHGHHGHGSGGTHGVGRHCKGWPGSRQGSKECPTCARLAAPSQQSFELEQHPPGDTGWHRKRLERMYSVDRVSDDGPIRTWFPKENLFSFHTATTTMQANFRKHLRMVGSRRVKAQTFAERRERSFSRSWSDPTPIKADSFHDSRESHDLQDSCGTLDGDFDLNWEAEKELEAMACDGEDFIPPKIMLISSKVPKAEYVPTIIRRDDPSIIPILYVSKQMIETYFDFRLYRLWKTRQHSKLLDYDDIL